MWINSLIKLIFIYSFNIPPPSHFPPPPIHPSFTPFPFPFARMKLLSLAQSAPETSIHLHALGLSRDSDFHPLHHRLWLMTHACHFSPHACSHACTSARLPTVTLNIQMKKKKQKQVLMLCFFTRKTKHCLGVGLWDRWIDFSFLLCVTLSCVAVSLYEQMEMVMKVILK